MNPIRHATERDADAIAKLANDLGYLTDPDGVRTGIVALSFSKSDSLFVATDSSDLPVGWLHAHSAYLLVSGIRVEILGLVVSNVVRRQGVGRALVTAAERWAASIGAKAVVVRSSVRRVESHAFYPAIGYETIKTQTVYRKPMTSSLPE
jgi:GNAT superfamily N-acetyltransferase